VRGDGGHWMGGMAVRFPDIDVTTINRSLPKSTLDRIEAVKNHHGHAGPAFVRAVVDHCYHTRTDDLRSAVRAAARKLAGDGADSARMRAAEPFGLLHIAGELARQFGLLPENANIAAAVRWAWNQFQRSSDALVLNPDEQIVSNLRGWIAERGGVTVKCTTPIIDDYGNVRGGNNREAVGWYDDDAVYIPTAHIREAAGGSFKETQIAEVLDRLNLLAKRQSDNRIAVRYVPKVGRVFSYALSRKEFGAGSDESVFTVHEGGRS
jgi:hypothetical protein